MAIPSGAVITAFGLSGAAGLIFEMVWFYRASLVLGNTVWAASIVLSSFMAGLGLGNFLAGWQHARIRSPLRLYALLEMIVGASGLAVVYALPPLSGVLAHLTPLASPTPGLLTGIRLGIAFSALLVPATAMGATLPVLVAAFCGGGLEVGRAFGRLYGWNTLGAVAGVLSTELVLIYTVGVIGAAWTAVGLNLTAAAIALWIAPRSTGIPVRSAESIARGGAVLALVWPLLACTSLTGAAFTALEVVWFRFLAMYVLTTTLPMSLMLAVVLAGIGVGGLIASGPIRRAAPRASVSTVAFLAACSVPLAYRLFGFATAGTQIGDWRQVLWLALVLTASTSVLSGALLTVLAECLARQAIHETRATAWLLVANTIGAMSGPLAAAFILLPRFGIEWSLFWISCVYVVAGGLAMLETRGAVRTSSRWIPAAAAGAAAVVLMTFPSGLMAHYEDRIVRPYAADGSEVIARREGTAESILLMRRQWLHHRVYDRLVTNGFSMSGTATSARRYMRYFAYLPMFLHAAPLRRALLICYGVGVTAGALTDIPSLEAIDVVETSPDIVAMSDLIYSPAEHPLHDPRVQLHVEDGRYFLQTNAQRYDVITGEPPPPRTPGAVNIYTREYFHLIYEHLAERGIATYWLPVARPDPGTDVNTVIRAFCDVFSDCSLWNATPSDFMLVGTRDGTGPVPSTNFTNAWHAPRLDAHLRDIGFEVPAQIGASFLGDSTYLRALVANTPPLTDNFPQRLRPSPDRSSLSDPRYNVDPAVIRQFEGVLDTSRARQHFAASPFVRKLWPPDLAAETLAFFDYERIVDQILWSGAQPLRQIEDLHALLTRTSLQTIPLWLLGTDDVIREIAAKADARDPSAEYIRALSALADRDYVGAAARFERAEALGLQVATLRPLLVYALCLEGRLDEARGRGNAVTPRTDDEQHFWRWMGSTFGVGPFARSS